MIGIFQALSLPTNICGQCDQMFFGLFMVLLIAVSYLLGSINSAIIISKAKYHDDIRNYGSGNAGLTNMNRVYGGSAATLTLIGDVLKQVIAVFFGVLAFGQVGAYIAGLFCMLGHIAPVFYHFRGGKGVLTAATLVLLIEFRAFLILFIVWVVVLLISRYVSLASILAAFTYPAVVFYLMQNNLGYADPFSLICALFIGCIIFVTHRENIRRLFNNQESKFSFKKSPEFQEILDKEDPETDRKNYQKALKEHEIRKAQEAEQKELDRKRKQKERAARIAKYSKYNKK